MGDAEVNQQLRDEIGKIKERLMAIEREQRKIREDILSGDAKERMKKRILENPPEKIEEKREKIDKEIKIEI